MWVWPSVILPGSDAAQHLSKVDMARRMRVSFLLQVYIHSGVSVATFVNPDLIIYRMHFNNINTFTRYFLPPSPYIVILGEEIEAGQSKLLC